MNTPNTPPKVTWDSFASGDVSGFESFYGGVHWRVYRHHNRGAWRVTRNGEIQRHPSRIGGFSNAARVFKKAYRGRAWVEDQIAEASEAAAASQVDGVNDG